jgi:serine/threonine protein kinase
MEFIQYDEIYGIDEIGSGGYGTVYAAKHREYSERVALKKFKNFAGKAELFISEVSTI